MERRRAPGSPRFDVGRVDHLAPFLGFVGDEPSEIGGRAAKHGAAQIGEPCLDPGVRESRGDLFVEFVDDFGRRVRGRAKAIPCACLIAGDEIAALARSAAPDNVSGPAGVKVLTPQGFKVVVEGKNGFVCLVLRGWGAPTLTTRKPFDF